MTAPFQTAGERPKWELVKDELNRLDIGDIITYDQLDAILECDFRTNRGPLYKAANEWGTERKRALRPVPNVGYRVVDAFEHEAIARQHQKKSRRALGRSKRVIENADRSRLSDEQRVKFDVIEMNISRMEEVQRRMARRLTRVETTTAEAAQQTAATSERVKRLEDALKRHGIEVGE